MKGHLEMSYKRTFVTLYRSIFKYLTRKFQFSTRIKLMGVYVCGITKYGPKI